MNKTEKKIVKSMRKLRNELSPVELAGIVAELYPEGLTQSSFLGFFHHAFPEIPVGVLRKADRWQALCDGNHGGISDEEFNSMLLKWTQKRRRWGLF